MTDARRTARDLPGMSGRGWLATGAVLTLLFVAYGSLVPFTRNAVGFADGLILFDLIVEGGLVVGSRVDFGSNVMLMIPAGFFLAGALYVPRKRVVNAIGAVFVLVLCGTWSIAVEFGQIFFAARSPSVSDVVAQFLGAATGIVAWWLWGARTWRRYFRDTAVRAGDRYARLLVVYGVGMLLYQLAPLDLTVNPHDLYDKWRAGRISLWPTMDAATGIAPIAYELFSDFAVWCPLGWLVVRWRRTTLADAFSACVLAIAAIEFAQIFVFSRHFAVSDVMVGALGAGVAAVLADRRARGVPAVRDAAFAAPTLAALALSAAWCGVLAVLFWYPYDVVLERAFVMPRLHAFFSLPFETYFNSTILAAGAALMRKFVLFMPLGIGLAWLARAWSGRVPRGVIAIGVAGIAAAAGFGIELGQIVIASRVAVVTDAAIMAAGALAGFAAARRFVGRPHGA